MNEWKLKKDIKKVFYLKKNKNHEKLWISFFSDHRNYSKFNVILSISLNVIKFFFQYYCIK